MKVDFALAFGREFGARRVSGRPLNLRAGVRQPDPAPARIDLGPFGGRQQVPACRPGGLDPKEPDLAGALGRPKRAQRAQRLVRAVRDRKAEPRSASPGDIKAAKGCINRPCSPAVKGPPARAVGRGLEEDGLLVMTP